MQVADALTPVPARVHDCAEPGLGDTLGKREVASEQEDLTQDATVPVPRVAKRRDVLPGNHEHVHRSLWFDVPEREQPLTVVHDVCRNVPGGDPAKEAVGCGHAPMVTRRRPRRETRHRTQHRGESRPDDAWKRTRGRRTLRRVGRAPTAPTREEP